MTFLKQLPEVFLSEMKKIWKSQYYPPKYGSQWGKGKEGDRMSKEKG